MLTKNLALDRPLPLKNSNGSILGEVGGWDKSDEFPIIDSGEPLVELDEVAPEIASRPAYHTADYRPLVRAGVATRLKYAQDLLPDKCQLVLLDGWRSQATQEQLYEAEFTRRLMGRELIGLSADEHLVLHTETSHYVSRPLTDRDIPPPHSTGGAVDVALLIDGGLVDFGSRFDEMSPRSALVYYEQNDDNLQARFYRRLLCNAMTNAGFEPYRYEWWHYNYGNQMATASTFHRSGKRGVACYGLIDNTD